MIDPQFIIVLKGKSYPTWPGILAAATEKGLRSLTTRVVQIPSPENGQVAVVLARAEFEDGRVFEDVGDASPDNCSKQIATAALRMASTRAKGRTLRDALNIGQTLFEELPSMDASESSPFAVESNGDARVQAGANGSGSPCCSECGIRLTGAQGVYSRKAFGRDLCSQHQKALGRS